VELKAWRWVGKISIAYTAGTRTMISEVPDLDLPPVDPFSWNPIDEKILFRRVGVDDESLA